MGNVNLDMRLLAQSYDTNNDGNVDDELKIQAPGLADKNGHVSVQALADALGKDQVVISNGAVVARQPGRTPRLPQIDSLNSIHQITQEALTWGSPFYPGPQYTSWHTRSDGSTYETYNWGSAILDFRAKLDAIAAVAGTQPDRTSQQIANIANQALIDNDWEYALDEGTAHTRYMALYSSMQSIDQLSNAPAQPTDAVGAMDGAVNGAENNIQGLGSTLKSGNWQGIDKRTQTKISAERQAASNVPWWHKVLIFGFFQSSGHNGTADRLGKELATYHNVDPNAEMQDLATVSQKAYQANVDSWSVQTLDDAANLQNEAGQVADAASKIGNQAQDQNQQLQDLLKTVGN